MLETLEDIIEHNKKIATMRTLLEQLHDDFYRNNKDGDGKDIQTIGWEEMETISAIENYLDSLELLSLKKYLKIIQYLPSELKLIKNKMQKFDIKDVATVAARLRRHTITKPATFVGSLAFKSDLTTLLDLIDKLKEKND